MAIVSEKTHGLELRSEKGLLGGCGVNKKLYRNNNNTQLSVQQKMLKRTDNPLNAHVSKFPQWCHRPATSSSIELNGLPDRWSPQADGKTMTAC